jgi:hypothetical protein
MQPERERGWADRRKLRGELDRLADSLVDASPADLPTLLPRVRHAVETYRSSGLEPGPLFRLLHYMLDDLSAESVTIDTLYYARQLAAQAEPLPN